MIKMTLEEAAEARVVSASQKASSRSSSAP